MAEKKALKGLKGSALFPVSVNTESAYQAGEKLKVPSAQALSKTDEKEDYEIFADDDTYDAGSDYKYTTLDLTVAELDTSLEAQISGGTFDDQDGVYKAKSTDIAPEYALVYAALMTGGGYRMFRHPVVKLMSIAVEHTTKGDSNDIAAYTLSFRAMARKIDSVYREQKDATKGEELTWLDSVPSLPPAGGGGEDDPEPEAGGGGEDDPENP